VSGHVLLLCLSVRPPPRPTLFPYTTLFRSGESIITGTMQTGELTSVIVYALQILMSLMMVTFVFTMIMIAEASTDRITEVLDEVPEMEDAADAVTEVKNGDIDFEHVNFSYAGEGGNLSLKDVNLHIKSGQIIGVIGGTGSAKSTLVQLIPRLYDVTDEIGRASCRERGEGSEG